VRPFDPFGRERVPAHAGDEHRYLGA